MTYIRLDVLCYNYYSVYSVKNGDSTLYTFSNPLLPGQDMTQGQFLSRV